MQIIILCSSLILVALMTGCGEGSRKGSSSKSAKAAEAARIEREVSQRVEQAGIESTERRTRMHTIRVVGFILLAGGAGVLLFRLQRQRGFHPTPVPQRLPPVTQWQDHHPLPSARVIETQAPKHPVQQSRSRNPSPSTPRRRNPNRRRSHRYAPKTRP